MQKENSSKPVTRPGIHESSFKNKRSGMDRRAHKKVRLKYLFFNGKREQNRRDEDSQKPYLFDRYHPKLFAAITTILSLSIVDGYLTLHLIDSGSSEINPVMNYFLAHGPLHFVAAKYLLTSFGVMLLLIFKNVLLPRTKIYTYSLFPCVIIVFTFVIVWEIVLIFLSS